jgi:hypothetical protein
MKFKVVFFCIIGIFIVSFSFIYFNTSKSYGQTKNLKEKTIDSLVSPDQREKEIIGIIKNAVKAKVYQKIVINNQNMVSELAGNILRSSEHQGAGECKCFDGFSEKDAAIGKWPSIIFIDARGNEATIYLPMGDCSIKVKGLPWGWSCREI